MYAVLKLIEKATIDIIGQKATLPLCLAEGMIGAMPIFKTKKDAKKSASNKYEVLEIKTKKL